jgi:prephenate dehydrogenase
LAGGFTKISILGPGLLGGSIALALLPGSGRSIHLWVRRSDAIPELLAKGFASEQVTTDLAAAISGADLVILCCPVGAMPALVDAMAQTGALASGCVVTDVGSVKSAVVAGLTPKVSALDAIFIGSHPMAGSENSGIAYARADLLIGAACLLTPHPSTPAQALQRLEQFWTSLGMRTAMLTPEEHDLALARVSHLPHAAAAALTLAALRPRPEDGALCGNGLRDSTRIAKGGAAMWSEILLENRAALLEPLRNLQGILGELLVFLENRDQEGLAEFLRDAKELREQLDRGN